MHRTRDTRASITLDARNAVHRAQTARTVAHRPNSSAPAPRSATQAPQAPQAPEHPTHKNEDEDRIQLDSEDSNPTPLSSCSICAPLLPLASPGDPRPLFKYALGGSGLGGVISEHTFWGTSDR